VKIGPVYREIGLLNLKKERNYKGKIYSPVGRFAKRAKNIGKIYSPSSKFAECAKNVFCDWAPSGPIRGVYIAPTDSRTPYTKWAAS